MKDGTLISQWDFDSNQRTQIIQGIAQFIPNYAQSIQTQSHI